VCRWCSVYLSPKPSAYKKNSENAENIENFYLKSCGVEREHTSAHHRFRALAVPDKLQIIKFEAGLVVLKC
jgi:hypothetical protein